MEREREREREEFIFWMGHRFAIIMRCEVIYLKR